MRVLVVSHNVFSLTNNMGKTLLSYFADFRPEEVAQFYIHSEVPTVDTVCRNYFRFTDKDAIASLNPFCRRGRRFGPSEIRSDLSSPRTDTGLTSDAYRLGQKRTPLIYLLRNLLWKLSRWNTPQLRRWVREFDPDVVFFASGDYGFMYHVAVKIADMAQKPLAVACVDDYYLNNRNGYSILGRMVHKNFLATARKTMARAGMIFTICDSMADAYRKLFQKDCRVLHTPAPPGGRELEGGTAISYIGNLLNGRSDCLVRLGQALQKLATGTFNSYIDVYSTETDPEILRPLTEENGIRFRGGVSAGEVRQIMSRSAAVIHTESFDKAQRDLVRFSVSTKIAESLMYGPPLIAYGPEDVASMEYLKANDAAFVITGEEAPETGLKSFLEDPHRRRQVLENARALAARNHDLRINSANVRCWLTELSSSSPNT